MAYDIQSNGSGHIGSVLRRAIETGRKENVCATEATNYTR